MAQPDRSQVRQRQPDAAPSGTPRLDRPLLVYTPLRIEQLAVAPGLPGARVLRCGMGPGRARRAACAAGGAGGPVAVAGLCGAVVPGVRPGDVVVASEVRGPHGVVACESRELAECLAGRGLGRVHVGPLACGARPVYGRRRAALARQGVIAADMESQLVKGVFLSADLATSMLLKIAVSSGTDKARAVKTIDRIRAGFLSKFISTFF